VITSNEKVVKLWNAQTWKASPLLAKQKFPEILKRINTICTQNKIRISLIYLPVAPKAEQPSPEYSTHLHNAMRLLQTHCASNNIEHFQAATLTAFLEAKKALSLPPSKSTCPWFLPSSATFSFGKYHPDNTIHGSIVPVLNEKWLAHQRKSIQLSYKYPNEIIEIDRNSANAIFSSKSAPPRTQDFAQLLRNPKQLFNRHEQASWQVQTSKRAAAKALLTPPAVLAKMLAD
jgi:hypothetical protein